MCVCSYFLLVCLYGVMYCQHLSVLVVHIQRIKRQNTHLVRCLELCYLVSGLYDGMFYFDEGPASLGIKNYGWVFSSGCCAMHSSPVMKSEG